MRLVEIPDILDVSDTDKTNRFLQNVNFSGFFQGAINTVKIDGNLSL